jgi:hypothetical protein
MPLLTIGMVTSKVSPSKYDTVPVGIWVAELGILTSARSDTVSPTTNEPPTYVLIIVGIGGGTVAMVTVKAVDVLGAKAPSPL